MKEVRGDMQDNFILENFTSAWIRCSKAWVPATSVLSFFRKPCLLEEEKSQQKTGPDAKVHCCCVSHVLHLPKGILSSMQILRSERSPLVPIYVLPVATPTLALKTLGRGRGETHDKMISLFLPPETFDSSCMSEVVDVFYKSQIAHILSSSAS